MTDWNQYARDVQAASNAAHNKDQKRIKELEAKLAKAVEALREISCKCVSNCDWERGDICPSWTARSTLAELEGEE